MCISKKASCSFTMYTEGHVLPLAKHYLRQQQPVFSGPILGEKYTCRRHQPLRTPVDKQYIMQPSSIDMTSVPYRPDADYASAIVGYTRADTLELYPRGQCVSPQSLSQFFDLTFTQDGRQRTSPNLIELVNGFLATSLSGLKMEIARQPKHSGGGYRLTGG